MIWWFRGLMLAVGLATCLWDRTIGFLVLMLMVGLAMAIADDH